MSINQLPRITDNSPVTDILLEEIRLRSSAFENVLDTFSITFDDSPAVDLDTLPADAIAALIVMEADSTSANLQRAARFTLGNGETPTASVGMPLGDNGLLEIYGRQALEDFLIIGIEAGKTHKIQVTLFSA